jgi:hypothetical protein
MSPLTPTSKVLSFPDLLNGFNLRATATQLRFIGYGSYLPDRSRTLNVSLMFPPSYPSDQLKIEQGVTEYE